MKLPRDFKEWMGPWRLVTQEWTTERGERASRTCWGRPYRERSHCDTEGCCEMEMLLLGPGFGVRLEEAAA